MANPEGRLGCLPGVGPLLALDEVFLLTGEATATTAGEEVDRDLLRLAPLETLPAAACLEDLFRQPLHGQSPLHLWQTQFGVPTPSSH